MYTLEDIRVNIHPVPQRVCALDKAPLALTPDSKFCLTAPAAERGPVKTAVERLCAFFAKSWGEMIDDLADKKFTLLKLDGYYTDYK